MSVGQDHSKKVLLGFRYRIPLARGEKTAEPWFCWDWVINCWLRILELFAGSNTPKCYRNAPWGTSTSSTLRFQALIYGLYPVHPSTLYTSCQTKWQWQNPNFLTKKKQTNSSNSCWSYHIHPQSSWFSNPKGAIQGIQEPPQKTAFSPCLAPCTWASKMDRTWFYCKRTKIRRNPQHSETMSVWAFFHLDPPDGVVPKFQWLDHP